VNFPDLRYEHFLAGSIALGPATQAAALRGVLVGEGKLKLEEIEIGRYIRRAVENMLTWQRGGNTHLGIILLFIPLATAAGKTMAETERIVEDELRENVVLIMQRTTPRDAVQVYKAIAMAMPAKKLGKLKMGRIPSVLDEDAERKVLSRGLSLYQCMKAAAEWDLICQEWESGMEISFKTGYPTLLRIFEKTNDINIAIVHTFLTILGKFGDTFIARTIGIEEAEFIEEAARIGRERTKWISEKAKGILRLGGLMTEKGRKALFEFDSILQKSKGKLNPGTTADLTASSIFIAILCGLRI
jgi:triphosphoribosyl-dephospho-CoA synthase